MLTDFDLFYKHQKNVIFAEVFSTKNHIKNAIFDQKPQILHLNGQF